MGVCLSGKRNGEPVNVPVAIFPRPAPLHPFIAQCVMQARFPERIRTKVSGRASRKIWRKSRHTGLEHGTIMRDAINLALTQVRGDAARVVWNHPAEFGYEPGCLRRPCSASLLGELRAIGTIDSLVVATALTREARNLHLALTDYAVTVTQMIFANVVASEPALYVAWPRLIRLYGSRVWSPLGPEARPTRYIKLMREIRLQADLSRSAGISLPPDKLLCKADRRKDARREQSEAGDDLAWTAQARLGSPLAFAGPKSFDYEWQEILGDSDE